MSNTKPTLADQIAALEAERAALFAERAPADARLRDLYDQRQALIEQQAATIDPTSAGGLETLWRIAWSDGMGSRVAGDRLDQFFRSFAPEIWGHEWRTTVGSSEVFPAPHLMLTRGQDVRTLATGLLALVRKLAAGREVLYVSLFEHSLSQYAIFGIDINVAAGTAVLHSTSYGRRTDLLTGSLADVLARSARDHWYQREPGATDESEDEDNWQDR